MRRPSASSTSRATAPSRCWSPAHTVPWSLVPTRCPPRRTSASPPTTWRNRPTRHAGLEPPSATRWGTSLSRSHPRARRAVRIQDYPCGRSTLCRFGIAAKGPRGGPTHGPHDHLLPPWVHPSRGWTLSSLICRHLLQSPVHDPPLLQNSRGPSPSVVEPKSAAPRDLRRRFDVHCGEFRGQPFEGVVVLLRKTPKEPQDVTTIEAPRVEGPAEILEERERVVNVVLRRHWAIARQVEIAPHGERRRIRVSGGRPEGALPSLLTSVLRLKKTNRARGTKAEVALIEACEVVTRRLSAAMAIRCP